MPSERKIRISYLKKVLYKATGMDEKRIAGEIKKIGFECKKCAQCCKSEYGDNTVIVFPAEIRNICKRTGLSCNDFAIPTPSEDRDIEGNIHTFEWILKKNSHCMFLEEDLCKIYDCRPYICSTYPFYLVDCRLEISDCMGLGGNISDKDSLALAALLKERLIAEIKESISLIDRFNGFNPGGSRICVHDSEGEHWLD